MTFPTIEARRPEPCELVRDIAEIMARHQAKSLFLSGVTEREIRGFVALAERVVERVRRPVGGME